MKNFFAVSICSAALIGAALLDVPAPIHAGEFASFCQLKPGRYRYKIVRQEPKDHVDAARRLEGEIIVGNAAQ